MNEFMEKLRAPFPPEKVSWRVGSTKKDKTAGLALAYIDARDVMERLDDVFGPEHWQAKYSHADKKTICELSIFCQMPDASWHWITKSNGAGDSDIEAEKGAISDAFKRAAVLWGIGRYLYELPNVWVDLEPAGNSFRIKKGQEWKLEKALNGVVPYEDIPQDTPEETPGDELSQAGFDRIQKKTEVTHWSKDALNDLVAMPGDERAAWLLKDQNAANLLWAKLNWPRLYERFVEIGVRLEDEEQQEAA